MLALLLELSMPCWQSAGAVTISSMLHWPLSTASMARRPVMILVRLAGERCSSMFFE